jgi:hypothetical protein
MAPQAKHLERTGQPVERRDTEPCSATRDKALKIERHADVMADGRPDELELFVRRSTVMDPRHSHQGPTPPTRSIVMCVTYPGGGSVMGGNTTAGPR